MATDGATDRFDGYEAELKIIKADLNQKLDQISELSGEQRKAAIKQAESTLDESVELLASMRMEKASIPQALKSKVNARLRDSESDIDAYKRKLETLSSDRSALFGGRYKDEPDGDEQLEQRQQLLSGTDRLTRSSARLHDAQRVANETETIGAGVLNDLAAQRATITHTQTTLQQSEVHVDRSVSTLRGMARRMATNRIVTIAIITILVILIITVIVNKFR